MPETRLMLKLYYQSWINYTSPVINYNYNYGKKVQLQLQLQLRQNFQLQLQLQLRGKSSITITITITRKKFNYNYNYDSITNKKLLRFNVLVCLVAVWPSGIAVDVHSADRVSIPSAI